jgi:LPXTG-motif cell wall-anchored protein
VVSLLVPSAAFAGERHHDHDKQTEWNTTTTTTKKTTTTTCPPKSTTTTTSTVPKTSTTISGPTTTVVVGPTTTELATTTTLGEVTTTAPAPSSSVVGRPGEVATPTPVVPHHEHHELPKTGGNDLELALMGAGILGAGGLLVAAGRRQAGQ